MGILAVCGHDGAMPIIASRLLTKAAGLVLVLLIMILGTGCGTTPAPKLTAPVDTTLSPKPVYMPLRVAWHRALDEAKSLPGGDVVVGSGDSMLPLYKHRTVLVIQEQDYDELQVGMTVIFFGDQGFPVAHNLVAKTKRGWTAAGVGNGYLDRTRVTPANYIGTAVSAYSPNDRGGAPVATDLEDLKDGIRVASLTTTPKLRSTQ